MSTNENDIINELMNEDLNWGLRNEEVRVEWGRFEDNNRHYE